jgi:hypothetical protein
LDSGVLSSPINDAGYRVGNVVAADNLGIGRTVAADSVNPIPLSRDAWLEVANRARVSPVETRSPVQTPKNISIGSKHEYPTFPVRSPLLGRR